MRHKSLRRAAAACGICLLLAGCWDRVEIDQRGFVLGIGIDAASDKKFRYLGTYQFVAPSGLKQSSATGSASSSTQAFFNLSTEEGSMSALSAKLASQTSRSPYFEHLKVIIISEELAKQPQEFSSLLDYFLRNSEMRRGVKVLIAEGKALDTLNVTPNNERIPASFIESIVNNTNKTTFMLPETAIGQIHEYLMRDESYVVQKVFTYPNGQISVTGCGVFDGRSNRMVGDLSGRETQGLNLLRGEIKGGVLEAGSGVSKIALYIERGKRTIRFDNSDGQMTFHINVQLEGVLDKSPNAVNLMNKKTVVEAEETLEKQVQDVCYATINKLQKTYRKDALGLGMYLYENHYKTWKPVSSEWDQGANYFSKVNVQVHTNVILRRIGNINESHTEEAEEGQSKSSNSSNGE